MQDENGQPKAWLLGGLGVLFVGALIAIFFLRASKPAPIAAPAAFAPYKAADGSFACLGPKGWQRQGGASGAIRAGVLFQQDAAKIDVSSDLAGSLMGDIARASNAQTENMAGLVPENMAASLPKTKPPVEQLHASAGRTMAKRLPGFEEQPMRPFRCQLGEARYSEWTADDNGFLRKGKLHGYRVTILNNDRRVTVLCQCPDGDWKTLQPAFQRVIASLAPGGGA